METISKVYLGIVVLVISVVVLIGIIRADMNVTSATEFHNTVVTKIENSNLSEHVITECIADAAASGYELEVEPFRTSSGETVSVRITLRYNYSFLGRAQSHEKVAYIR